MSDVKNIKLLAFDVDGTLTPGDLIFGKEGEVYKLSLIHISEPTRPY